MIVKVFISPINYTLEKLYKKDTEEVLIGVDKGAYHALKEGLDLDMVLGDFDSVTADEDAYIKKHAKKRKTFAERKDHTDAYLAIKEALLLDPEEIIVYGGIGDRIDHTYANILLLKQGHISFVSDHQKMFALSPGTYHIDNPFDFISLFALEDVNQLSLEGFSFTLKHYDLSIDDPLCISNQGSGTLSFTDGVLLVVLASDKK